MKICCFDAGFTHNPIFSEGNAKGATLTRRSEAGELAGASHQVGLDTEKREILRHC